MDSALEVRTLNNYIFHSVNSGLYFWDGTTGLLLDGIHDGEEQGFSAIPNQLFDPENPNNSLLPHIQGLLFTHLHPDHFSARKVQEILTLYPSIEICGPELNGSISLSDVCSSVRVGSVGSIRFWGIETLHDGIPFHNAPHWSYILHCGKECFFIAGDAAPKALDAELVSSICNERLTAAFLNIYQLASAQGIDFLRALKPNRIYLNHLPLPMDDHAHLYDIAHQILKTFPSDLGQLELLPSLGWLKGCKPLWTTF